MVSMTAEIVKRVNIPVTVKTRLGWSQDTIRIVEVAERLQDIGIQAISIHARTRQQMYKGEADWSYLNLVKENPRLHIPVFGNGDIDSPEKAQEYRTKYNVDGMMIGRASIGYPWIFNEIKHYFATGEKLPTPDLDERLAVTKKHLDFSVEWKGEKQGILEMRRHYTSYFRGMPNFKTFRTEMVTADSYAQVCEILNQVSEVYADYEF
jgi:nifR3 family TIM-barrel protein